MRLPDMNAQARAAYETWALQQDDEGRDGWAELSDAEHDRWRRAVRLLALLGREGTRDAPVRK